MKIKQGGKISAVQWLNEEQKMFIGQWVKEEWKIHDRNQESRMFASLDMTTRFLQIFWTVFKNTATE